MHSLAATKYRTFVLIGLLYAWSLIWLPLTYGATIIVDPTMGETISDALVQAVSGDEIVLLDGIYVGPGNRNLVIPPEIDSLTIRGSSHPEYCIIDSQTWAPILAAQGTDLIIRDIRFRNGNGESGSAVFCSGGSLDARNCEFIDNIAGGDGGAVCLLNTDGSTLSNCLFSGNNSVTGAAVYMDFTDNTQIFHSTFSGNNSGNSAVIHARHSDNLHVLYSILWNPGTEEIIMEAGTLEVAYSNVDQIFPDPNMSSDPMFVPGSFGDHYLMQISGGYQSDSPSVDAFDGILAADFPEFADRTTSSYNQTDTDELDLGYHYFQDTTFVTPTPTATPEPSPTPTATPTPTFTPGPTPEFEVELSLEDSELAPGDFFDLSLNVANWVDQENPLRLLVILDVYNSYFFYPAWTDEFQFEYNSLAIGRSGFPLLQFTWPTVEGKATGLVVYAGFMNAEGSELIYDPAFPDSALSSVSFSYTDEL